MHLILAWCVVTLDEIGHMIISHHASNAERTGLSFVELVSDSLSFHEHQLTNLICRGLSVTIVTLFR